MSWKIIILCLIVFILLRCSLLQLHSWVANLVVVGLVVLGAKLISKRT